VLPVILDRKTCELLPTSRKNAGVWETYDGRFSTRRREKKLSNRQRGWALVDNTAHEHDDTVYDSLELCQIEVVKRLVLEQMVPMRNALTATDTESALIFLDRLTDALIGPGHE
jgi:hypothetical protein